MVLRQGFTLPGTDQDGRPKRVLSAKRPTRHPERQRLPERQGGKSIGQTRVCPMCLRYFSRANRPCFPCMCHTEQSEVSQEILRYAQDDK